MKLLLENWREYLNEGKEAIVVPTRDEIVRYINNSPHQEIYLDNPKGSSKAFGRGKKNKVIFRWPNYKTNNRIQKYRRLYF